MKTRFFFFLMLLSQWGWGQFLDFKNTGALKITPNATPPILNDRESMSISIDNPDASPLIKNLDKIALWKSQPPPNNVIFQGLFPNADFNFYKAFLKFPNSKYVQYQFPFIIVRVPPFSYWPFGSVLPFSYWPLKSLSSPHYSGTPLSVVISPPTKINITRTLYDNEIIEKHLNTTKVLYKYPWNPTNPTFMELSRNFKRISFSIDSLLTIDSTRHLHSKQPFNIDVVIKMLEIFPYQEVSNEYFDKVMDGNRDWIKSWLWYTGGDIRLNPFPYYDTAPFLKTTYAQKRLVEERINLLKSSVASGSFSNFTDNEQNLTRLTAVWTAINDQLVALKKDSTNAANWLADTQKKSVVLYEGQWPTSTNEKLNWMVHYNYAKANGKIEAKQLTPKESLPKTVSEIDQVAAVIHNVPKGTDIDLKATEAPIELMTNTEGSLKPFATNFLASLNGLENIQKIASSMELFFGATVLRNSSSSLLATAPNEADKYSAEFLSSVGLANINDFTKFLEEVKTELNFKKIIDINSFNGYVSTLNATSRVFSDYLDVVSIIDNYDNWLQNYRTSKQKFEWLASQSMPLLEIKEFKDDPVPAFRTVVKYPEDSLKADAKTREITYKLLVGKDQVAKASYKKHELIRWWPTAGVMWIPNSRSYDSFDASKGTFTEETVSHVEAVVGVKLYPWKTNIATTPEERKLIRNSHSRSYNIKRGNNILNRIFVFGGLGVTKNIFKNYCIGAGIDIIPGVSVQAGRNFIAQKSYDFDKGQVQREYEHFNGNGYFGVNFDLGIVTKLLPIFKK
jgi:hypothetical protein